MKYYRNWMLLALGALMTSALLPSAAFADETDPQATEIVPESNTAAESVIVGPCALLL